MVYSIFTYHKNQPFIVGKYTIHGWYGVYVIMYFNFNIQEHVVIWMQNTTQEQWHVKVSLGPTHKQCNICNSRGVDGYILGESSIYVKMRIRSV